MGVAAVVAHFSYIFEAHMLIQIDYVWVEFKLIVHVVQNIHKSSFKMINPTHEHLLCFALLCFVFR